MISNSFFLNYIFNANFRSSDAIVFNINISMSDSFLASFIYNLIFNLLSIFR